MTPDFSAQRRGNRVAVTGDIDMATAPLLREALASANHGPAPLVVDLSGATFLDSAGVAIFFDYVPESLELIVSPGSVINAVLEITGLSKVAKVRHEVSGANPQE